VHLQDERLKQKAMKSVSGLPGNSNPLVVSAIMLHENTLSCRLGSKVEEISVSIMKAD
jgi:hypothetical protein